MDVGSLFADVRAAPRDRCVYCGKHDDGKLHADHLVPKHRGGLESGDNLVWACRSCNSSKGAKDLLEWYADRSAFPSVPLMRRYLKLALAEATSRGVMDCRLDECPSVTFSIDYIPTRYPTASAPRVIEKRERPRPD
jgi:hypothetical protein